MGNPQRDAAGTQRKSPGERKTNRGKGRAQEREEMKKRKTDIQIEGKRAHGTGEAIRKGIEEMKGTERRGGKGTSW